MNNKVVDIIVPVYGKDPKYIFDNLEEIALKLNDECGMIIVYKNSDKFNYDLLKKLESNNVLVFEVDTNSQKTDKLILAVEKSNSKYIVPMDSHHSIIVENLIQSLDLFKKSNNLIFSMEKFEINIDDGVEVIGKVGWLTAGSYVLNTQILKKVIKEIDYRVTFSDDLTFPLFVTKELENTKEIEKIDNIFYIKNRGTEISMTTFNHNDEITKILLKSLKTILSSTFKYYDSSKQFNSQYLTCFWYYILRIKNMDINRGVLFNKQIVSEYWYEITSNYKMDDFLKKGNVFENRLDRGNEFFKKILSED